MLILLGVVSFESSAIPPAYMSVLTIDMPKLTTGLGLGLEVDAWRFDMVFAHIFGLDVDVDPRDARSPQLMPVAANVENPHYINGGTYSARANVLGLGLRYAFDYDDEEEDEDEDEEGEAPAEQVMAPSPMGAAAAQPGEGDDGGGEDDEDVEDDEDAEDDEGDEAG